LGVGLEARNSQLGFRSDLGVILGDLKKIDQIELLDQTDYLNGKLPDKTGFWMKFT